MSRVKLLVPLIVLALSLLWPLAAIAADGPDPITCLPDCYAYDYGAPGHTVPSSPDGTVRRPWYIDTPKMPESDHPETWVKLNALRSEMGKAVKDRYYKASLLAIVCSDTQPPNCSATLYTYFRSGTEQFQTLDVVDVPEVGVPLPFSYILSGIALLGVLLVGTGVFLRRRTKHLKS